MSWFKKRDKMEIVLAGIQGDVVELIKDTMSVNRYVEVTRCAWKGPRQPITVKKNRGIK